MFLELFLLLCFLIFLVWIFFKLYGKYDKRRILKNYNPEEDLSRQGKEFQDNLIKKGETKNAKGKRNQGKRSRKNRKTGVSAASVDGSSESYERGILPPATSIDARKTDDSTGKNRRLSRVLERFRKGK